MEEEVSMNFDLTTIKLVIGTDVIRCHNNHDQKIPFDVNSEILERFASVYILQNATIDVLQEPQVNDRCSSRAASE